VVGLAFEYEQWLGWHQHQALTENTAAVHDKSANNVSAKAESGRFAGIFVLDSVGEQQDTARGVP